MKKERKIIFFVCLTIFIIICGLEIFNKSFLLDIDNAVYNFIMETRNPFSDSFYKIFTNFAGVIFLIMLSLIIILFCLLYRKEKYAFIIISNLAYTVIINLFLKYTFVQKRPDVLQLVTENGYSFPSAHAMAAMAFYGFLIYLVWKLDLEKRTSWLLTIILGEIIFVVSYSRIYLGVHYFSDVLAGLMIACALNMLFITFYADKHIWKKKRSWSFLKK